MDIAHVDHLHGKVTSPGFLTLSCHRCAMVRSSSAMAGYLCRRFFDPPGSSPSFDRKSVVAFQRLIAIRCSVEHLAVLHQFPTTAPHCELPTRGPVNRIVRRFGAGHSHGERVEAIYGPIRWHCYPGPLSFPAEISCCPPRPSGWLVLARRPAERPRASRISSSFLLTIWGVMMSARAAPPI